MSAGSAESYLKLAPIGEFQMPQQPMKRRPDHSENCQKRRQKEFEGGLPDKAIKLYINAWFPEWLSGENPDSDRATSVWTGSSGKLGPGAIGGVAETIG